MTNLHRISLTSSSLTSVGSQEGEENLTWLEYDPDLDVIYAVHEVTAYEGVQPESGVISRWGREATGGEWVKQEVRIM